MVKSTEKIDQVALERFLTTAKEKGCPKDQIENFLQGGYVPQPKQLDFHSLARQCDTDAELDQIGFGGSRGPGKALALDTPIPTPDGWATMESLKKGDIVFNERGEKTKIIATSKIMENRDCYEVIFRDGERIVADANHSWVTLDHKTRRRNAKLTDEYREKRRKVREHRGKGLKPWLAKLNSLREYKYKEPSTGKEITTEGIFKSLKYRGETNHSVTIQGHLVLNEIKLDIDPYVLGAWLGDGSSTNCHITSADPQIIDEIKIFHKVDKLTAKYLYSIKGLYSKLRKANLFKNKHIPQEYLRGSFGQRVHLLQGLMDTDGTVDRDGYCQFTTTSKKLKEGMIELLASLGVRSVAREGRAKLYGKDCGPKWNFNFAPNFNCFRLKRKKKKQKKELTSIIKNRFIVDVIKVPSVPVKCIKVDCESGMFLAGKTMVPTHNSHALFAQAALDDCKRIPGLKVLYLRRIGKQAKEQLEDLRTSVLFATPHEYRRHESVITFPQWGGSRILLGHFKDERDIEAYLGLEYDVIIIEEATTLSIDKYKALRDSNRTSKRDFNPRIYCSTNPGGRGHVWFKKRFIEPWRQDKEIHTRFVPATLDDNAFIDDGYKRRVEENTGWKLKAHRYGEWDIAAGQYFTDWGEIHILPNDYPIESWWRRFGAFDHGFNHPYVFGAFAVDGDGDVYMYAEAGDRHKKADEIVADIVTTCAEAKGMTIWAGHDCWSRQKDGGPQIVEQFHKLGLRLVQANINRIHGANQLRDYLDWRQDDEGNVTKMPRLYIKANCWRTIQQIPAMICDEKNPEDVLKVDATEDDAWCGDDAYDMLRYGMMSRPRLSVEDIKPKNNLQAAEKQMLREIQNSSKKIGRG